MLLNSSIVSAIGVLMFRVLRGTHPATAWTYALARGAEALLLAAGLTLLNADTACQLAMLALGLGNLMFCVALKQTGLLPGWMAFWGFGGYSLLVAGALAELSGIGVGLALSVPGGLFELVFGIALLWRGLPVSRHATLTDPATNRTFPRDAAIQEVVVGTPPM